MPRDVGSSLQRLGWPTIFGLTLVGVVVPLAFAFNNSDEGKSVPHGPKKTRAQAARPERATRAQAARPERETRAQAARPERETRAQAARPERETRARTVHPVTSSPAVAAVATQQGVRRPLVVIDPGHGGSNRGAFGPSIGRYEKELTLALARRIKQALISRRPPVRVRLTRNRDRYLTLAQRVTLANGWKADVFVSLHFNASPARTQTGFETYVLSRQATDDEAARLALAENRAPSPMTRLKAGVSADRNRTHLVQVDPGPSGPSRAEDPSKDADLRALLTDLRQRQFHLRSHRLGQAIQNALAKARPKAINRGVRQAPFDVLLGLKMPGVLAEIGFIDHSREGSELNGDAAQNQVARAIAQAIVNFVDGSG